MCVNFPKCRAVVTSRNANKSDKINIANAGLKTILLSKNQHINYHIPNTIICEWSTLQLCLILQGIIHADRNMYYQKEKDRHSSQKIQPIYTLHQNNCHSKQIYRYFPFTTYIPHTTEHASFYGRGLGCREGERLRRRRGA
jgi:hypothetical protein